MRHGIAPVASGGMTCQLRRWQCYRPLPREHPALPRRQSRPLRARPARRALRELLPARQPPNATARVLDPLHGLQPRRAPRRGRGRALGHLVRRGIAPPRRGQGRRADRGLPILPHGALRPHRRRDARGRAPPRRRRVTRSSRRVGPGVRRRRAPASFAARAAIRNRRAARQGARRPAARALSRYAHGRRPPDRGDRLGRQPEPQLGEPPHRPLRLGPGGGVR